MHKVEPLLPGNFYHIYNPGVVNRGLFREPEKYDYFFDLYDKYIRPIAETVAWVLMKNQFHLLGRIKEEVEEVEAATPDSIQNPVRGHVPSLQFSTLFNSYAQAVNKRFSLHAALFEYPFKRKRIHHPAYLKNAVFFIPNNLVHPGFCSHPLAYSWRRYLTCISLKPTRLRRDTVLGWFNLEANFKHRHNNKVDIEQIE